jgi:hypothetical protein
MAFDTPYHNKKEDLKMDLGEELNMYHLPVIKALEKIRIDVEKK